MSEEKEVFDFEVACHCGDVEIAIKGPKMFSSICHCPNDTKSHSAFAIHVIAFPDNAVTFTKGKEKLKRSKASKVVDRSFCTECGTTILQKPDGFPFTAFHPVHIKGRDTKKPLDKKFLPEVHTNYENAQILFNDNLPKFADFPKDLGGSGKMMTNDGKIIE